MKTKILDLKLKYFFTIKPNIANAIGIFLGSLLIAILAQISIHIPFSPVPITGQTIGVLLIGGILGSRKGLLSVAAYIGEGALGLPVFASGGGIAYLSGPTAGYLYGMTLSAVFISYLANKGYTLTYLKTSMTLLLASVIIFSLGIFYLGSIIGYEKAVQAGLLPFIPSELFKIALAVAILPTLHNFLKTK